MTKLYTLLAICLSILSLSIFTGCDSDEGRPNDNYLFEDVMTVTSTTADPIGTDGSYQYGGLTSGGEATRVVVVDHTEIYVQRPSCSGLERSDATDIKGGYTIIFKYTPDDANVTAEPQIIKPRIIEAYRPECVGSITNLII